MQQPGLVPYQAFQFGDGRGGVVTADNVAALPIAELERLVGAKAGLLHRVLGVETVAAG